ncbi:MAG: glycosyltransferase [Bacteroidales bacterium]|nr:glycosyltransferase [Bacteroidales bacterium]
MKRIVTFGPGPQFKGGIANYNTSLAKALDRNEDLEVHIVSWTQQYPAIIPRDFIDRKSKKDQLAGYRIKVHYLLNYNRPGTWRKTVRFIRDLNPDRVIIQWAIAIQGIPLRYMARKLQKAGIRVFFDLHFVVQKENSNLDRLLTRRCIRFSDVYITHSLKTFKELKELIPGRDYRLSGMDDTPPSTGIPVLKLFHPVYDMFQKDESFDVERFKSSLGLKEHVFLFFGFIRKYKGLHNVIEAFNLVAQQRDDVSLLIVGELFWNTLDSRKFSTRLKNALFGLAKKLFLKKQDDEQNYRPLDLVEKYELQDRVVAITEFVPNEDVHKYFQTSDSITLFYLTATPSGVESMAYNFGMPILATRVGHFPETIQHGFNGYLAEPDNPSSMAEVMVQSIESPILADNVYATSAEMSWDNYASVILKH